VALRWRETQDLAREFRGPDESQAAFRRILRIDRHREKKAADHDQPAVLIAIDLPRLASNGHPGL